jgi:hypothetical protein
MTQNGPQRAPDPSTPHPSHDRIRATRAAAKHYSIKPSDKRIRSTTATRSKDSHRGIVIHRSRPAFGRPVARLQPLDLDRRPFKIAHRWSPC